MRSEYDTQVIWETTYDPTNPTTQKSYVDRVGEFTLTVTNGVL